MTAPGPIPKKNHNKVIIQAIGIKFLFSDGKPAYSLRNFIDDRSLVSELDKIIYSPVDVFHFGFDKKNIQNIKDNATREIEEILVCMDISI